MIKLFCDACTKEVVGTDMQWMAEFSSVQMPSSSLFGGKKNSNQPQVQKIMLCRACGEVVRKNIVEMNQKNGQ